MNPGCLAQNQLNTSEPTAPYVKAPLGPGSIQDKALEKKCSDNLAHRHRSPRRGSVSGLKSQLLGPVLFFLKLHLPKESSRRVQCRVHHMSVDNERPHRWGVRKPKCQGQGHVHFDCEYLKNRACVTIVMKYEEPYGLSIGIFHLDI